MAGRGCSSWAVVHGWNPEPVLLESFHIAEHGHGLLAGPKLPVNYSQGQMAPTFPGRDTPGWGNLPVPMGSA